jgi:hypothetical protein
MVGSQTKEEWEEWKKARVLKRTIREKILKAEGFEPISKEERIKTSV